MSLAGLLSDDFPNDIDDGDLREGRQLGSQLDLRIS